MKEIIQIENLSFEYPSDHTIVINQLNLKVTQGQFIAILGPNGSGKSTLAKLLNGILLPKSGVVVVDQINTSDDEQVWKIRQQLGIVFQNPDNQIVANTVEEDVAFGLENLGLAPTEIQFRVDQALEKLDMSLYKYKEPHHLSGGQKQKVAISGILAMKPKIIVFDEATSMLDPKGRKEVMETAKALNEEGITIIHITHHLEEAMNAGRILVMDQGVIKLDGQAKDVFKDVALLKKMGLDVPIHVELAYRLRNKGIPVSENIVSEEEIIKELWKFR